MKAWQPVPTLNSTIAIFSVLSFIFLFFGIILTAYSANIKDASVRYDTLCPTVNLPTVVSVFNPTLCYVAINIPEDMPGPVFIYYELDNFYQNHRRYVKSKSVNQLQGESVTESDISDCSPIIKYSDLRKYRVVPPNL